MKGQRSCSPKTELAERLALLWAADEGRLDGLPCPNCEHATASVWFTRRSEGDYWTWVVCSHCDFEMRAQGARPAHYSPARELAARGKPGAEGT
jgi:hypothetical protein